MNTRTKKLTTLAMFCALSYAVMVIGRIPVVLFLKYDPKDIIITIAGFIFGPLSALVVSVVVSFFELITVSSDGIIGFIMNVIATCSFSCTAAYIYKKKHSLKGAILGLLTGIVAMTAAMILWNYYLSPIFMGYPREEVVKLLIPAFLPFNLIKGGINAAVTIIIYKPVVKALRRAQLIEVEKGTAKGKINLGVMLLAALVLTSCIMYILVLQGVI